MLEASPPLRRLEVGVEAEGGTPEEGCEAPDGGFEVWNYRGRLGKSVYISTDTLYLEKLEQKFKMF